MGKFSLSTTSNVTYIDVVGNYSMKIRTNKLMDKKIIEIGYDFINFNLTIPPELQGLIDDGFRIEQDCVLFKDFIYFGPGELDTDFSKTQYEEFLNDIHIDNYLKAVTEETEYLKVGLEFSKRLWGKLQSEFKTNFRIIVSFSETSFAENNVDIFGDCVVKFYKVRQGSEDKFKFENLEEYETEGVLVIE